MKRKLFLSIAIGILFLISNGQESEQPVFTKVENEAHTNPKAWAEHIRKETQLPDSVSKDIPPGSYKVNVQFIIDKHGSIGQVRSKNDPGYGLAARAVKIVSGYKGEWQPANQCGRNVNAYREQSITFVISQ